jgi:hypothetical protein
LLHSRNTAAVPASAAAAPLLARRPRPPHSPRTHTSGRPQRRRRVRSLSSPLPSIDHHRRRRRGRHHQNTSLRHRRHHHWGLVEFYRSTTSLLLTRHNPGSLGRQAQFSINNTDTYIILFIYNPRHEQSIGRRPRRHLTPHPAPQAHANIYTHLYTSVHITTELNTHSIRSKQLAT